MAHYAFLDENNVVVEVIVGKDEGEAGIDWEQHYGDFRGLVCKRTSYNTRNGIHYDPETRQPSADQSKAFRHNYAGINALYDPVRDLFTQSKPFASWLLNETTLAWEPPVPKPTDGKKYRWDEDQQNWTEIVRKTKDSSG
jgi:hypothetical protein